MPTVRTGPSVFPRLQYRLLRPSAAHRLPAARIVILRRSYGNCCHYSTTTAATSTDPKSTPSDSHVPPPSASSSNELDNTNNHATPVVTPTPSAFRHCPFHFEAGYGLHAKRHSRPFPPPFLSRPSGSFSDPLSTHHGARDRRPKINGELIRGVTNGDDAVLVSDNFICANDGVGAWATREKGHAALWSRLIIHFWAQEMETGAPCGEKADTPQDKQEDALGLGPTGEEPNPVLYLSRAFEKTKQATSDPNDWFGTTTASGALLGSDSRGDGESPLPVLYVTQLGDSAVMVVRPKQQEIIYKTKEQWHWFDCPRQLGTNSPDTPETNAVMDRVEIEEGDVVLAMSDGVCDNLWDHEVMQNVIDSMHRWDNGEAHYNAKPQEEGEDTPAWQSDRMMYVAQELVKAARTIAEDPFAESPYMEKAIDEGLSIEGGKRDDISVVIGRCARGT